MITAALLALCLGAVYWYFTKTFGYWKKRGVKHDKPIWLFGNNLRGYLMQKSMTQIGVEMYKKYPKERVVGFFRSTRPELIIRDPDIIKYIITADFNYFYYRGLAPNRDAIEPLSKNLFEVDGEMWNLLRQRITPAFSSGKLKAMFPLIAERAERLQLRAAAAAEQPLDAKDLMVRYTTDFIGACGFGLDSDSLNDENSEFRKLGAKIFEVSAWDALLYFLKQTFPDIFKNIRLRGKIEKDVNALVENIFRQRNYKPSGRNDFIDLMLECQSRGTMVAESLMKVKSDGTPILVSAELTRELMVAQVFLFFGAGFETSSTATSFTLHQLAYHPDVQRKVQAEIDHVLAKYENKLCYDAVREMRYLEWAFKEGMRMFPSLGFLYRECARKYVFEDLKFSIDEGVRVLIPVQALHNDEVYFPEPGKFIPERFDRRKYNVRNKFTYLPFGDGPRGCIGARLGLVQSLAGLAAVLSRFTVETAPGSRRTPLVDPRSNLVQSVLGGLPLIFRKRDRS